MSIWGDKMADESADNYARLQQELENATRAVKQIEGTVILIRNCLVSGDIDGAKRAVRSLGIPCP